MRNWNPMMVLRISSFLLSVFLLSSCYEKQEGCLDSNAVNFDFEADETCCPEEDSEDCCCDYPEMRMTVKHIAGEGNMSLGTPYYNDLGQLYMIESVAFFTSGYSVQDGTWYGVNDTVEVNSPDGHILLVADDATEISRSAFEFPVGKFLRPGMYDSLRFSIGLDSILNSADTADFQTNHPLRPSNNVLYNDSTGYLMYRVELVTDTTTSEVRTFSVPAFPPSSLTMAIDLEHEKGQNLSLPVEIDYSEWFKAIDFDLDSDSLVAEKVKRGLLRSFQPVE